MASDFSSDALRRKELQLFIETICCDLLRFEHSSSLGIKPEQVRITQEVYLGPASFADLRVEAPGLAPYFVEVKHGYSEADLIRTIVRKYGNRANVPSGISKILLVIDPEQERGWNRIESAIQQEAQPGLKLEVWTESILLGHLKQRFGVEIEHISADVAHDVRLTIDSAKGQYAFGEEFSNDPLQESLLWHFSFWSLRQARVDRGVESRALLLPGPYRNIAVIFADLSSFSSYVRDTRDEAVVRYVLTTFYSKARYEIINRGGMLYQFLGDGVLALFGLIGNGDYFDNALECATVLTAIGDSVSNEWQRQIDHVQHTSGCHIGIAVGDVQVFSLRPFSRTHVGAIGDSVNLAARLSSAAQSGETVVSNTFYQRLPPAAQITFESMMPVEAKNIGMIKAWKRRAGGRAQLRGTDLQPVESVGSNP